ncbi:MAG: rhomboid family intramembrane serine protease [Acidobacteriota bacterium]
MAFLKRQTSGSVVCPSCGRLVGIQDEACYNCGRRNPGMWGYAGSLRRLGRDMGVSKIILGGCALLYIISLAIDPKNIGGGGLFGLLGPSRVALFTLGASGAVPVFELDRWWTLLSAGWLHGGLLHIGFNLYWLRMLVPASVEQYGAGRMLILYTVAGALGFAASSTAGYVFPGVPLLGGAGFTVGASAPLFGLLGALIYAGRRGGSSELSRMAKQWALVLFIFGLLFPGVDNWAHAGGFVGGYFGGKILDPMKPERLDHLIAGLLCLLLTLVAVVLSAVTGVSLIRQMYGVG